MRFQTDKLKHIAAGLVVVALVFGFTCDLWWTWGAVVAVATVKEAIDATGRGHVEARDWLATILPAGLPTILVFWEVI